MQQILTNNRTANPATLLRNTLFANAIFSTICALIFMFESQPIDEFLGLGMPSAILVIGVGLLLFAAELFWIATRLLMNRRAATVILALDIVWVVGSLLVLVEGVPALSSNGWWAVAIVADIVAGFAILEFIGIRRMATEKQ